MNENLPTELIKPKLLKISYFDRSGIAQNTKSRGRYAYDYEIEYYVFSKGGIVIDNVFHQTKSGMINFRRPGQTLQGVYPSICYTMVIDITGDKKPSDTVYKFGVPQPAQPLYINPVLDGIPPLFMVPSPDWYCNVFQGILNEQINHNVVSDIRTRSLLMRLIYQMYLDGQDVLSQSKESSPHYPAIIKAKEYIKNNFNKDIDVSAIAEHVNMSTNYFHKIFVHSLNITPGNYINHYRLSKAKEMLAYTTMPVYEIAFACGFETSTYFNYVFKRSVGQTPAHYRRQYQKDI